MSMTISMTGKEDREGPWKLAIAGFPGAGKTLFGSTAADPLFVFFQENPRVKSIADRHIPHVKLSNSVTSGGVVAVQDKLAALVLSLGMAETEYKTLVIDTGDELFQAMKAGRRLKNGGEFGVGDWGWIADAYREVMAGLIDLPMNVIVLYHLKSDKDGEDGFMVRQLALQGQVLDEAPGWFDVVGALDTFETTNEQGDSVTKRVLLTHSSRMYPWVKDHSGALPARFQISDNFVGDFKNLMDLLHAGDTIESRAVLEELTVPEQPVSVENLPIPTPEELDQVKGKHTAPPKKKEKVQAKEPEPVVEDVPEAVEQEVEPEPEVQPEVVPESIPTESVSASEGVSEEASPDDPSDEMISSGTTAEQDQESPVTPEEAEANVKEALGAVGIRACADCGAEVTDVDVLELSQIRFREDLCREHFAGRIKQAQAS